MLSLKMLRLYQLSALVISKSSQAQVKKLITSHESLEQLILKLVILMRFEDSQHIRCTSRTINNILPFEILSVNVLYFPTLNSVIQLYNMPICPNTQHKHSCAPACLFVHTVQTFDQLSS